MQVALPFRKLCPRHLPSAGPRIRMVSVDVSKQRAAGWPGHGSALDIKSTSIESLDIFLGSKDANDSMLVDLTQEVQVCKDISLVKRLQLMYIDVRVLSNRPFGTFWYMQCWIHSGSLQPAGFTWDSAIFRSWVGVTSVFPATLCLWETWISNWQTSLWQSANVKRSCKNRMKQDETREDWFDKRKTMK